MEHNDIYRILENLDSAQQSVKQLPALFKPKDTSPQLSGPYPGRNATRGYLVGEGEEANPMARAVTRRIVNQHPEWIVKYGVEALMQAIDDVTEDADDFEEIGSSDISAYVQYVKDALDDRMGSREEMDDRRPFAEGKVKQLALDIDSLTDQEFQKIYGKPKKSFLNQPKPTRPAAPAKLKPYLDFYGRRDQDFCPQCQRGDNRCVCETNDASIDKIKYNQLVTALNAARKAGDMAKAKQIGDELMKLGGGSFEIDIHGQAKPMSESATTEDVISTVKKKLGDYLSDLSKEIKSDSDLKDRLPADIDQIKAVKTIRTDDGHEIKIHGNEDDGFRITIRNREMKTPFQNLDEAVMATEMYCAKRRNMKSAADYIEEKS